MTKLDIGSTISERRKALGLTQKQVADRLNVTDKAVSKWERGQGYPDITMLGNLAEALELTISELMQGGKHVEHTDGADDIDEETDPEVAIGNTIEYADTLIAKERGSLMWIVQLLITGVCLIAIFTCFIVDLAINNALTWSWIVLAAVAELWLIVIPLLPFRRVRTVISMCAMTVATPALMWVISWYVNGYQGQYWRVGLPPLVMGLAGLWVLVGVWFFTRMNFLYKLSLTAVVGAILSGAITSTVTRALGGPFVVTNTLINVFSCLLCAGLLAIGGAIFSRRRNIKKPAKLDEPIDKTSDPTSIDSH